MNAVAKKREAGARGGAASGKHTFQIEGESLTYEDIAARLGISKSGAENKMRALRKKEGAITWEALGLKVTKPLPLAKRSMRTFVFDTETTGLIKPSISDLKQQPKIIEFAVVELDDDYNEVAVHEWLINPGEPITEEITKITGITNDDLRGKPSFIEVLPEIERAFMGVDRVVAHNLPFDWAMLTNELKRLGREYAFPYPPNQVCTVQLASDLLYGRRARLIELYEKATGKPLAQTHRALDDVRALCEVLRAFRW